MAREIDKARKDRSDAEQRAKMARLATYKRAKRLPQAERDAMQAEADATMLAAWNEAEAEYKARFDELRIAGNL